MRRVHDLGAARDGGERQTARDALGGGDQVRDDALVLAGEPLAGAAEAGLDLVGDEDDAVVSAHHAASAAGSPRRLDEPALARDRLDDDRGDVVGADLLVICVDGLRGRLGAGVLRRRSASGSG